MRAVEAEVDGKYTAIDASLQNLLAQISSINTAIAALQSRGVVKSVQRGIITFKDSVTETTTATIKAVDTSKAVIIGAGTSNGNSSYCGEGMLVLTNATTVTAKQDGNYPVTTIPWQVIEFY